MRINGFENMLVLGILEVNNIGQCKLTDISYIFPEVMNICVSYKHMRGTKNVF